MTTTDSELAVYEGPPTLFGTTDPRVALERMSELARVLVDVVRSQRLSVRIGGRDHLYAEAWTALGGMLGVVPVVCWTRPNETGDGYVARVEARTLDGRVVGAAESECSRAETTWEARDPYTLRSMAQTRAIGRALRAPLGQIVVLAGYDPAGAEEVPAVVEAEPKPDLPTREQVEEIRTLVGALRRIEPETDWPSRCREIVGVPAEQMSGARAGFLVEKLQGQLAQLAGGDEAA
jgi:hypothetical protein